MLLPVERFSLLVVPSLTFLLYRSFVAVTGMLQHSTLKYLKHTNVQALKFVRVLHLSAVRRLVDILEQEDCDASLMSTASTVSTLTSNTSSVAFLVVELETKAMQRLVKISQLRVG